MTGLTLPGMMLEPAWRAGRLISPKPACGPEESRRRSLQIFDSLIALRLSDDENDMNAPVSLVDSTRSVGEIQVEPGDLAQVPQDRGAVVGMRRDAGADRRRAHVDLVEEVGVLLEAAVVLAEGRGEAVELLPERHRHGILQLRATDLQDVVELDGLREERLAQQVELLEQRLQVETEPDLDGRRVDVVRRLAAVGVVDRREERVVALLAGRPARARCW